MISVCEPEVVCSVYMCKAELRVSVCRLAAGPRGLSKLSISCKNVPKATPHRKSPGLVICCNMPEDHPVTKLYINQSNHYTIIPYKKQEPQRKQNVREFVSTRYRQGCSKDGSRATAPRSPSCRSRTSYNAPISDLEPQKYALSARAIATSLVIAQQAGADRSMRNSTNNWNSKQQACIVPTTVTPTKPLNERVILSETAYLPLYR